MGQTLHVRTLGGCQLLLDDRPVTALTSAKARALLVYLAFTGRPQLRSSLSGLLWSDLPEETARANLRLTLTRIRKVLPDVVTAADQVGLAVDQPVQVDAAEFTELCDADPAAAAALYTGEFLADLEVPGAPLFEEWVERERAVLHGRALSVLERLLADARGRRDCRNGVEIARRILALEPYQEEAHRALMWFLAASGQRNAALAQYDTCRHAFAAELGTAPSPATRALRAQIENAAGFRELDQPPAPAARAGLPTAATSFVGREEELRRFGAWFDDAACRIVTIVGPGGVGKTRLALALAEQRRPAYADGVAFASFVGTSAPGPEQVGHLVVAGLAQAVGLALTARRDPFDVLVDHLAGRNLLLVVDNVEQLRDAGGVLARLVAGAQGVQALVTSRVRLGLAIEWVAELGGLPFPPTPEEDVDAARFDAVRLFLDRARAVHPATDPASRMADVGRVCRAVEGMPLAIELASRWTRSVPVTVVADRLAAGIDLLTTSAPDVEARHRSMRTVLDASWRLLTDAEQRALARLSTFRGGFDLAAAAAVADARVELLTELVDHSWVRVHEDGRYTVHELLRQYAAERLAEGPDADDALRRHAEFFEALATRLEPSFELNAVVRELEPDVGNLRAATGWLGEHADDARLAAHLDHFVVLCRFKGWFREAAAVCTTALRRPGVDPALQGHWTRTIGEAHLQLSELPTSRDVLERAFGLLGRRMPGTETGWAGLFAAELLRRGGRALRPGGAVSRSAARRAVAADQAWAGMHLTEVLVLLEERTASATLAVLTLNAADRSGSVEARAVGRAGAGFAAGFLRAGRVQRRYLDTATADAEHSTDPVVAGYVPMVSALQRIGLGDWDEALASLERSIAVGADRGLYRIVDQAMLLRGITHLCTGRFADTAVDAAAGVASGLRRGDHTVLLWGLLTGMESAFRTGQFEPSEIEGRCEQARKLLDTGIPRWDAVRVDAAAARLALGRDEPAAAWRAVRSAAAIVADAPLPVAYVLPGFLGYVDAVVALRVAGRVDDAAGLDQAVRSALGRLRELARIYPAGRPAYHLHRGSLHWQQGRRRAAVRSWIRAVREAEQRRMPYELARAHLELGRWPDRPTSGLTPVEHLSAARRTLDTLGCAPDVASVDAALR